MPLAKALYSNVADSPEELSFSQGDVIKVIEKDVGGLVGWWLCSVSGKTGIAPGNRLQLINSQTDSSPRRVKSVNFEDNIPPASTTARNKQEYRQSDKVLLAQRNSANSTCLYDVPNRILQDYDIPAARYSMSQQGSIFYPSSELSFNNTQSSVVQPNYDVPSSIMANSPATTTQLSQSFNADRNIYDSPSSAQTGLYDCPSSLLSGEGDYEVPPGALLSLSNRSSVLSTGSHASSTCSPRSSGAYFSARSSTDVSGQELYDIAPPARAVMLGGERVGVASYDSIDGVNQNQIGSSGFVGGSNDRALASQLSNGMPTAAVSNVRHESGIHGQNDTLNEHPIKTVGMPHQSTTTKPSGSENLRDSLLDDYSVPRSDTSASSTDSGISMTLSQRGEQQRHDVIPNTHLEDLYDSPRNHMPDCSSSSGLKQPMNRALAIFAQDGGCQVYDVPSMLSSNTARASTIGSQVSNVTNLSNHTPVVNWLQESAARQENYSKNEQSSTFVNSFDQRLSLESARSLGNDVDTTSIAGGRSLTKQPPPALKPKPPKRADVDQNSILQPSDNRQLVQERPLPSPPLPHAQSMIPPITKIQESPRSSLLSAGGTIGSKADVSVLVCSSMSSLAEWNDECDYVTIANNAEREFQRDAYTSPASSISHLLHAEDLVASLPKTNNNEGSGTLSQRFKERLEAVQKLQSPGQQQQQRQQQQHVITPAAVSSHSSSGLSLSNAAGEETLAMGHKQIIEFYVAQADVVFVDVRAAADEFFRSERKPIVFAPRARSVVLAAHKLVYISDAMLRAMASDDSDVAVMGNALCDSLKSAVTAIKFAMVASTDASALGRMENCIMEAVSSAVELVDVIHVYASRTLRNLV